VSENSPKFKKGDKVVIVNKLVMFDEVTRSKVFVVYSITTTDSYSQKFGNYAYFPQDGIGAYEYELELEEVVNSPLYQALL
jgi:hypothetical protein